MYCIHCGAQNADTAKFCMKCGRPMAAATAGRAVSPPVSPAAVDYPPPLIEHGEPEPVSAGAGAPARRRRVWPWVVALVVVALIVFAVGAAAVAARLLHVGSNDAVALLPDDTSVVLSISPSPGQLLPLQKHLSAGTLTTLGGAAAAPAAVATGMDAGTLGSLAGGLNLDPQRDLLPWIGAEMTAGLVDAGEGGPSLVAAIAMRNRRAATGFTDKIRSRVGDSGGPFADETYGGVGIAYNESAKRGQGLAYAQVKGFLVLSDSVTALKRVIDTSQGKGKGLNTNATYRDFQQQVSGSRTGYLYLGMEELSRLSGGGMDEVLAVLPLQAVGAKFAVDGQGMRMDFVLELDADRLTTAQEKTLQSGKPIRNRVLDAIPADAIFAMTGPGLRTTLDQFALLGDEGREISESIDSALSQFGLSAEDLYGWMGDEWAVAGIEPGDRQLIPDMPVDFLALFAAGDRKKAESSLRKLVQVLEQQAGLSSETVKLDGSQFTLIREPFSGIALGYGIVGDYAVIGLSENALQMAAAAGKKPLSQSPAFKAVRGRLPASNAGYVFVDARRAVELLRGTMDSAARRSFDESVGPYVKNIQAVGLATEPAGKDILRGAVYVLLADEALR